MVQRKRWEDDCRAAVRDDAEARRQADRIADRVVEVLRREVGRYQATPPPALGVLVVRVETEPHDHRTDRVDLGAMLSDEASGLGKHNGRGTA